MELRGEQGKSCLAGVVCPDDLAVEVDAKIALLLQESEEWLELRVCRNFDRKKYESLAMGEIREAPGRYGVAGIGTNDIPRGGVHGVGATGEQELQVIINLGDRSHCGTG